MAKFNRAQRRAIEKRVFRANLKIDNVQQEAADQRVEDVAHRVAQICLRAICLTELFHWKDLAKKDKRIENTIDIMHEYVNKIKNNSLSDAEYLATKEIDRALTEWWRTHDEEVKQNEF